MTVVIKREKVCPTFTYGSLDRNHREVHIFPVFEDYSRL